MKKQLWKVLALFMIMVTGTCAWILSAQIHSSRFVEMEIQKAMIASGDMRVEVYRRNADGTYAKVETSDDFIVEGLVPNDTVEFKLRIYNESGMTQSASIYFDGISLSTGELYKDETDDRKEELKENFFSYIYAGCMDAAGTGYDLNLADRPLSKYVSLSAISTALEGGTYSCCFYSGFEIPKSENTADYVELPCYIILDRNADNDCMDMEFSMEHIRFVI